MARLTKLSRSIAGKVAVVTGAASGMGRATAHLFADEGAHVAVVDLGEARVAAVVEEITGAGLSGKGFVCDVADPVAIHTLVDDVVAAFGGLDILVNNAGVAIVGGTTAPEAEFEDGWAATLDVNLTAHIRLVRAALPYLQRSGEGRVVNIASTEAIVAAAGMPAYAASKAGVVGLTKSLAVELGKTGVTVNCICPGPIRTGMTAGIPEDAKETYARRRVPLRRYADPEEVAQMTLSMVLPAASYLNGAILPVDGGMTIRHT
ncbi:MAG: SDR family NAD(P)-dependent oxidoreductase [Acidimicrobiales bacterium]